MKPALYIKPQQDDMVVCWDKKRQSIAVRCKCALRRCKKKQLHILHLYAGDKRMTCISHLQSFGYRGQGTSKSAPSTNRQHLNAFSQLLKQWSSNIGTLCSRSARYYSLGHWSHWYSGSGSVFCEQHGFCRTKPPSHIAQFMLHRHHGDESIPLIGLPLKPCGTRHVSFDELPIVVCKPTSGHNHPNLVNTTNPWRPGKLLGADSPTTPGMLRRGALVFCVNSYRRLVNTAAAI
ncbi:hypothetical protein VFPPC_16456 [Pochonia chlamydosporia 170]|uniref:Uncharacterized protein n=1 Tax=Pochonia chlamydosporia 170 TaxID=1380566 RepID=A0A179FCV8_METCM|nr:hypothetical protein VFPPC_16456 [Pochonia chlamydosporia 170]OAQ63322.1 hypothetical protein VFPPC_16456 [Pochonia chlamydosporia 170]